MKYIKCLIAAALCLLATGATYAQDLVPQNASLSTNYNVAANSIPEEGYYTFEVDIKNIATSGSSPYGTIRYYISRKSFYDNTADLVATTYTNTLAPGATSRQTINRRLDSDIDPRDNGWYFHVRITSGDSNFANNYLAFPFVVLNGAADLYPYSISVPANMEAGKTESISFRIGNMGSFGAVPFNTKVYLSTNNTLGGDYELADVSSSHLAAGSNRLFSINAVLPSNAQNYNYIIFQADPNNQAHELSYTNNVVVLPVSISQARPDLIIATSSSPGSVIINGNKSINVSATVENDGGATAGASTLRYWLSSNQTVGGGDVQLASVSVPSLAAGATWLNNRTVTINGSTNEGQYYILVQADAQNQVTESDENNNVDINNFYVVEGYVDLKVEEFTAIGEDTYTPSSGTELIPASRAGNYFTPGLRFKNEGNISSGNFTITYWLSTDNSLSTSSDTRLEVEAVQSLAAGAENNGTVSRLDIPSSLTSTNKVYYLIALVDDGNFTNDSNTANNVKAKKVYIRSASSGRPGGGLNPPCCIIPPGGGPGFARQAGPGLEQPGAFELKTYPNPAKGSTTVSLGAMGNYNVQLVDAQGRQVLQRQVQNTNSTSLDLTGLKKGIYLLKAQGAAGVKTQRLVVQ